MWVDRMVLMYYSTYLLPRYQIGVLAWRAFLRIPGMRPGCRAS